MTLCHFAQDPGHFAQDPARNFRPCSKIVPPAIKLSRRETSPSFPLFPKTQVSLFSSLFLPVICFWRNLSKSLIPLSDCPVRA
jgi:hypothetical protein